MDICNFLQEADTLLDSNGSKIATWKNQETRRLVVDELKSSNPEIYHNFLRKSTNRILRISK
jgi:hypothetical protein